MAASSLLPTVYLFCTVLSFSFYLFGNGPGNVINFNNYVLQRKIYDSKRSFIFRECSLRSCACISIQILARGGKKNNFYRAYGGNSFLCCFSPSTTQLRFIYIYIYVNEFIVYIYLFARLFYSVRRLRKKKQRTTIFSLSILYYKFDSDTTVINLTRAKNGESN